MVSLQQRMIAYLEKSGVCCKDKMLLVAFSGGPDSTALLHLLQQSGAQLGYAGLAACHVHHMLRGEEADRDAAFCRDFCADREILFFLRKENVPLRMKEMGESAETAARELRYACLQQVAEEWQRQTGKEVLICTAHHAEDQAETILFRLARGTGLGGLCGISPKRENLLRPLLFAQKKELLALLDQIPFCIDSTNQTDEANRNKLRHRVLPVLEEINPAFVRSLEEHREFWANEEDFLRQETQKAAESCLQEGCLLQQPFLALHPAMGQRVILLWLAKEGLPTDLRHVKEIRRVLQGERAAYEPKKGVRFFRFKGNVFLEREGLTPPEPIAFSAFEREISYQKGKMRFFLEILEDVHRKYIENLKKPLFLLIDYDKIKGSVVVRPPKAEDRIALPGLSGRKKVSELLKEAGIPVCLQPFVPVITDDSGLLGILHPACKRCDNRCRVTEKTTRVLQIRLKMD